MKEHPQYYSAQEAQLKLGLSRSAFFNRVKQGLIPKVVLPGNKIGMYPKRDIDALALSLSPVVPDYVFSASSPADQVEERQIGIRCFGSNFITSLAERIAFQQKYPLTFHSLKVHGKVVSYISMFRLPNSLLDDLLSGHKLEKEITIHQILPFVRLENFSVYIDVVAVDPQLSNHLRRLYAGLLVFHFTSLILELLSNNYQITDLYTVVVSQEGENLFKKMGFQVMEGTSLVSSRKALRYILDAQGIANFQARVRSFYKRFHRFSP